MNVSNVLVSKAELVLSQGIRIVFEKEIREERKEKKKDYLKVF